MNIYYDRILIYNKVVEKNVGQYYLDIVSKTNLISMKSDMYLYI